MKIALLGAPSAGKTKVAKSLALALNKDGDQKWKVVDLYVEGLANRTGRQYGEAGGFPHNTQVMCERWTCEAEAVHKGFYTITCGTIYETIIYAARQVVNIPLLDNESDILTWSTYADVCMRFFGAMEDSTFNYDLMFYLPWDEETATLHAHTWAAVVNEKIPEILDAEFKAAITLRGTHKEKVAYALTQIRLMRDAFDKASPDDER